MKIVVLGATGMLGHAVAKHMLDSYGVDSVWLSSQKNTGRKLYENFGPVRQFSQDLGIGDVGLSAIPIDADYVINCIGIIKPFIESVGIAQTLLINSVFPHLLAQYCSIHGIKLIHITTDCVYSGQKGHYREEDIHDATDVYGRSKSLGEPIEDAMVLRTSIIGREIHKHASLVAWVQSNAGQVVSGYRNHLWNGITTKTYAECCRKIIDENWWQKGLFHIFSPSYVTKCQLVQMISHVLDLNVKVTPVDAAIPCDRTLTTGIPLCDMLQIPDLEQQMKGL